MYVGLVSNNHDLTAKMRLKSNEKERKCYNYQHAIKHAISSVSESFMKQQVFLLTTISNLHFYLSPGLHASLYMQKQSANLLNLSLSAIKQ